MPRIVSVLLPHPACLEPDLPGLPVHGANLVIGAQLRLLAADPRIEALEVFLPPEWMAQHARLAEVAAAVLPADRQGMGALRFYPVHAIPDVWADPQPRILFCTDPEWMPRERYLRDRFAAGPMPISCDTHAMGHYQMWPPLQRLAAAPPVAFDSIVCIGRAYREALRIAFEGFLAPEAGFQALPCRLDHCPHGVDAELFRPSSPERQADARRILGLPLDKRICLFLGRLTPAGKADLLPLVAAFAQAAGPEDVLLIAGDEGAAGYAERLREEGASLGLGGRLILQTSVPSRTRSLYYTAADLFVFPGDTVQEALANTVLEAMASGLPVVISDWDGMRDLVDDEITGIVVPTWWMPAQERVSALSPASTLSADYLYLAQALWVETTALAEALARLLRSAEMRRKMGAAGRARIEAGLTWSHVVDRLLLLWDDLAEAAAAESPRDRGTRRAYAQRLGIAPPFASVFGHYATGVLDPARHAVRLTEAGRMVVKGRATLRFYDDTLPMLRRPVMDALFEQLVCAEESWTLIADLSEDVAEETHTPVDDVRFHIALLLKRGMLQLCRSPEAGN